MAGSWIGSALYRLRHGFVAVDPAMAQALGYTSEQMAGRLGDDFMYVPDAWLTQEILRITHEGNCCRATTCYRHGVTGGPLWLTVEVAPMAPVSPDLILVTLVMVDYAGAPSVEALPGSATPTSKLRDLDLDVGMLLHRHVSDLWEILERQQAMREAIQNALRGLLTEERPARTLEDRLYELEERVDRLLTLITTPGRNRGDV
jgi:hypothetical protein